MRFYLFNYCDPRFMTSPPLPHLCADVLVLVCMNVNVNDEKRVLEWSHRTA